MSGTPIYDIKPYLPFADSYPNAQGGFAEEVKNYCLTVQFEEEGVLSAEQKAALTKVLEQDPRPSYQDDPQRIYAFTFGTFTVKFSVSNGVLTVKSVT